MYSRAATAVALLLCAGAAFAQDPVWVDVSPFVDVAPNTEDPIEEVERRYTPELVEELKAANEDALLLFTEFSAKTGQGLTKFLKEITGFVNETLVGLDPVAFENAPEPCLDKLKESLTRIEYNARRAAHFSAVNHHKFLLGHMIVFRMHLNKSEDYIKKCDEVISSCGISCEKTPRIKRWRRHAADELHRFRDDLQHSRRSYRDLLLHSHRKLNHIRRQTSRQAKEATDEFQICTRI